MLGCLSGPPYLLDFFCSGSSVLFAVESLSLLYLLFISWFICSRRWCIDKVGSFMQTKHLCVLIHIWTKGEVGAPLNWFKPSSKIFLLTVPRRYFFCGSFVLFMFCVCVLIHIWTKGEIGAPSNWLSPPVKYFTDRSKAYFFCGYFFFWLVFAMHLYASIYVCLLVTCWERAYLLALVCGV